MKIGGKYLRNSLKLGLWLHDRYVVGQVVVWKPDEDEGMDRLVVCWQNKDAGGACWKQTYLGLDKLPVTCRVASSDDLDATGVEDEDRLVEQQKWTRRFKVYRHSKRPSVYAFQLLGRSVVSSGRFDFVVDLVDELPTTDSLLGRFFRRLPPDEILLSLFEDPSVVANAKRVIDVNDNYDNGDDDDDDDDDEADKRKPKADESNEDESNDSPPLSRSEAIKVFDDLIKGLDKLASNKKLPISDRRIYLRLKLLLADRL